MRTMLLVLLAAACTTQLSASRMHARVLGISPGGGTEPLPGARLTISCPDGLVRELGVTDNDGRVNVSQSIAPALDCTLTAEEPGFRTVSYEVGRVCEERAANSCIAMDLRVVLDRGGSGY